MEEKFRSNSFQLFGEGTALSPWSNLDFLACNLFLKMKINIGGSITDLEDTKVLAYGDFSTKLFSLSTQINETSKTSLRLGTPESTVVWNVAQNLILRTYGECWLDLLTLLFSPLFSNADCGSLRFSRKFSTKNQVTLHLWSLQIN